MRRRRFAKAALALCAILALVLPVACGDEDGAGPGGDVGELKSEKSRITNPDVAAGDLAELAHDNTAFALDLYQVLRDEEGNLLYSPFSISIALAMTFAGARTTTEQAMADVLHFTLGQQGLHPAFNKLDLELIDREANPGPDADDGFKLRIANSIWGQVGFPFESEFLDVLALNYGAGLNLLDFSADPEACRQTINEWVEDRTAGKIEDLLPKMSITTLTRLVLTNALYFKAAWNAPFEEKSTAEGDFQLLEGGTVTTDMMHQVEDLPYGSGDGWEAASLPYDGEQLDMVLIVPADFETYEAGLTAEGLEAVLGSLSEHSLTLALPKFSFKSGFSLAQTLEDMGMGIAMSDAADFSGIADAPGLKITDVFHKTFIAVNEAGTEAAAATAVVVGYDSAPPAATLTVDRPFLFLIRDIPTGTILFVGRVLDPTT